MQALSDVSNTPDEEGYTRPRVRRPYRKSQWWTAHETGESPHTEIISAVQARELAVRNHERRIAYAKRWLAHYENRLAYEKAMLAEQGAAELLEKKPRPKPLPLCNYRAPDGIAVHRFDGHGLAERYAQVEMSQAEYAAIHGDYKGTRAVGHSHRVRIAIVHGKLACVFLNDAKTHEPPPAKESAPLAAPVPALLQRDSRERVRSDFDDLREALKCGVQIVCANQLFATPKELARRVVHEASGGVGMAGLRFLDPSAGTGALLKAGIDSATGADLCRSTAVEINERLARLLIEQRNRTLRASEATHRIVCADFLSCTVEQLGLFDAVVMNPPFQSAQDIEHIRHAVQFVKPGGRLVAICAAGPRQHEKLKPWAEARGGVWELLAANSFKESGTSVNAALLSVQL